MRRSISSDTLKPAAVKGFNNGLVAVAFRLAEVNGCLQLVNLGQAQNIGQLAPKAGPSSNSVGSLVMISSIIIYRKKDFNPGDDPRLGAGTDAQFVKPTVQIL